MSSVNGQRSVSIDWRRLSQAVPTPAAQQRLLRVAELPVKRLDASDKVKVFLYFYDNRLCSFSLKEPKLMMDMGFYVIFKV